MDLSTREGRREQGERIKRAAREAGVTLDELARLIGCSRALIYQYASGASLIQTDRLQQIASSLSRPLTWFFLDDLGDTQAEAHSHERAEAQAELQAERDQLAAERAQFEQRRLEDDIQRLQVLLEAYSSPVNPRKIADTCRELSSLLGRSGDSDRLAGILLQQGNALIRLQEWGPAKETLEQAAALFRQANKPASERDCIQSIGHANLMLGRIDEAVRQFEYVAASDDWTNRWQGTLSLGAAQEAGGEYASAISSFERCREIVLERGDGSNTESARLYIDANWANLELDFGEFRSAWRRSQGVLRAALRQGVQDQYIEALLTGGVARLCLGEVTEALDLLRQALDISQLIRDQQHAAVSLGGLSLCETELRHASAAIKLGKEALAVALRSGAVRAEALAQRALAEAYLLAGNATEALYHTEQGTAAAGALKMRLAQTQFRILTARAFHAEGRFEEAEAEARLALAEAGDLQARPAQIDAALVASAAAIASGRTEAASAAIAQARFSAERSEYAHWWRIHAVEACVAPAEAQETAFEPALRTLRTLRRQRTDAGEEDNLMEDPLVLMMWQEWIKATLNRSGTDAAAAAVREAEWPPLVDWFQTLLQTGSEK